MSSEDSAVGPASDRGLSSATKVTNDPEAQDRSEGTGVITSDSLAGESLKGDGSFGEDNPRAAAMDQPSEGTTTNNEDTSGATTLPPADQKSTRDDPVEDNESSELNSGTGEGNTEGTRESKDEGSDPTYATVASEAPDREQESSKSENQDGLLFQTQDQDQSSGQDKKPETFAEDDTNAATAPSYVNATDLRDAEQKPKGKNLTEGGFDDDAKNTSFDAEIGSKDDPGKLAERKFENFGDQPGEDAAESKEGNITGENERFGTLEDTEA